MLDLSSGGGDLVDRMLDPKGQVGERAMAYEETTSVY